MYWCARELTGVGARRVLRPLWWPDDHPSRTADTGGTRTENELASGDVTERRPVDPTELEWDGDRAFVFRGCHFTVSRLQDRRASDELSFTLVKSRRYVDCYLNKLNFPAVGIVEVGFFEGGSSVFLDRFYRPHRLVCIDQRVEPIPAVEQYKIRYGRRENLRMVYGVDQGDQAELAAIVDEELPEGIDLVIDDASHQYELTKATLGVLLPRVRPGGAYVIEDWGWAHGPQFQAEDHPWFGSPALSNLVFELSAALASDTELIESIHLDRMMAIITRSVTPSSREVWDVSAAITARGASISLI